MMKLRGIEFGPVFNASGARNFFASDGWWFHDLFNGMMMPLDFFGAGFGLHYVGCTFVAKTATLRPRRGNMELVRGTTSPREWWPQCIKISWKHMAVLNKVGLSNPGFERLLDEGYWQANTEPFVLSFMALANGGELRLAETNAFAELLAERLGAFCAPVALQVNFSCPNVGHAQKELIDEAGVALDLLSHRLPDVPLIPKFSVMISPSAAAKIASHPACDAVVVSNTIPWGEYPSRIPWKEIFGSETSPLEGMGGPGGGGLSGAPLLPFVLEWVRGARAIKFPKPIIAGGGILGVEDVREVAKAGASGMEVGSASILAPWRVQRIIDEGNKVFP